MSKDELVIRPDTLTNILATGEVETTKHPERISEVVRIQEKPAVSIVIPIFNEAKSLESLVEGLKRLLESLDQTCEVILVDDGSTDGSVGLLREFYEDDPRFRIVLFRRNFGQSAAFSAGFAYARGDIIVTMDGDLQNDPADIPLLLQKIEAGYDIASGWRVCRRDNWLVRKLPSKIANWLISAVTGVKLHDYGCSLKAYRREVLELTKLYGEMHRFIPALASWVGVTVAEVPVNHYARRYGKSKYGISRTIRVFLDLLTVKFLLDYATRPIQIFGFFGLLSFSAGMVLGVYLSVLRLFYGQPLADRPILLLVVLLVVIGVQLIIMGLLGELVVRTYHETQGKPTYIIREVLSTQHPESH
ncbi:MAG: glycosyltransferase family 2 protein [Anaerolineales bacterium]|nr:glycosyltransferase family 2 protein [Anaerolineales bacterium]